MADPAAAAAPALAGDNDAHEPDGRGHAGDDAAGRSRPDDPPEASDGRPTGADSDQSREPHAQEDEAGYNELRSVQSQLVCNYFYAGVNAGGATFGFGSATTPGLAPGPMHAPDITRALRHYVRPEVCYAEAESKLRSQNLLVIVGEEGSGRRAGALALLRHVLGAETDLLSMSPANSLNTLSGDGSTIKADQGYVIFDYVGEHHVDAVQTFAVHRLREKLRRKRSYLVITAAQGTLRRQALRDFCTEWHAPEALTLFDHCVARAQVPNISSDQMTIIRTLAGELRRPGDVVEVATRLAEGADAALETLQDSAKQSVRKWFEDKPPLEELLPVAALTFADGLPERLFEERFIKLAAHVRNWERAAEDPAAEPQLPPPITDITQSRARWQSIGGLTHAVYRPGPDQDESRSERCVEFASPPIRALVVSELHERYGYQLWYPLRKWLEDLANDPELAVRTEVARGVALLARHAIAEVDENLLHGWADGLVKQRVTAALTLQFMGGDQRLAPHALGLALRWSDKRGQLRAMTAAMAFAGKLGLLYRMEALNWLWHLTTRGERVASAARNSLILLLLTAEHQPTAVLTVLRYVRTKLAHASTGRERANALTVATEMLLAKRLAEGPSQPEPLAAHLMRSEPWAPTQLGSLWTSTLLSPRRSAAITALCRTLNALREDPSAPGRIRDLGAEMRAGMTVQQWAALRHDLSIVLKKPHYAIPDIHALASALLGSLRPASRRHHPPTRSRRQSK